MKSKIARILLWVLTVFMVLVAFAYFPSVASILAILFAVICAPVEKLQDFFRAKNLKGVVKGVLLTVLFFASIMATPTAKTSLDTVNDTPEEIEESDTQAEEPTNEAQLEDAEDSILPEEADEPQDAEAPTEEQTEPQESTGIQEQSTPDTESSAPPTQPIQPDTQEPEKTAQEPSNSQSGGNNNFNTYDNEDQQNTRDYVLNTSTMKFHYPSCNSVKKIAPENYSTYSGTRDQIIAKGYFPCGKCNP